MFVCYIQFAGYTSVYAVLRMQLYVESNSVLVANDDTTSAVSPTRRGAHEDVWNGEGETSMPPLKRGCFDSAV